VFSAFHWDRIAAGILARLTRFGVRIVPYFVVREGSGPEESVEVGTQFTCGFIGPESLPQLLRLEPWIDEKEYADCFSQGNLCYAVKDGERIVAKMWCALKVLSHPGSRRMLHEDEVNMFGAYTDPDYRGHELAPFMRARCYEALREMGRRRFYSYTDYFNTRARRFKLKVGAVNEALRIHIDLFGRFSRTWTIRKYR